MISQDDSNYKREEDRKWRERTDERMVGFTSSETVQNDRLDEIDDELATIREIFDGKQEDRDDNGLKGDVRELTRSYNELRALMAPDHLGHGGIINRLKAVEEKVGIRARQTDNFWKFWTAIGVALISLIGLLLTNWDKVQRYINAKSNDPLDQIIEKAKHPKGRRVHRTVVRTDPDPEPPE